MFNSDSNEKCCPICKKLTYTDEPNCIECILCKLCVHSHKGTSCVKHWTDEDLEDLDKDDNFYCCTCIDKLLAFQRSTGEDSSIENVMNCLRSFNLDGITIRTREEIELMTVIIGRALGEDTD